MKFSVFTHVNHIRSGKGIFAYAPYVREMNLWLEKVDEVEIIAPDSASQKGVSIEGESYQHPNLRFNAIPSISFLTLGSAVRSAFQLPSISLKIFRAMRRADHIHLRCPGNIGLLACLVQVFFPNKPKSAKYAGNWDPEAEQPWSYKLQKKILNNTFLTKKMTVLVYGNWRSQSKNVRSFFTASFKEADKEEIIKQLKLPYRFLYVGNLVPGKQPLLAIKLVQALNKGNIDAELDVYGNGELRSILEAAAKNESYIHFHGNRPLGILQEVYKKGHFLVLASRSEGWPKAVAEAMFFGCIPIATPVSCVPWMLGAPPAPEGGAKRVTFTKRGILAPPTPEGGANIDEWFEEIVKNVEELIYNPEEMRRMSMAAQEWSQQYTLEKFEEAIKNVLFEKDSRP